MSELATNAVDATSANESEDDSIVRVRLTIERETLYLIVWDRNVVAPTVEQSGPDKERGRGLILVETLSARWGHRPAKRGGKFVWCALDTDAKRTKSGLPIRSPYPVPPARRPLCLDIDLVTLERVADRFQVLV
jgi:hypothetical protein